MHFHPKGLHVMKKTASALTTFVALTLAFALPVACSSSSPSSGGNGTDGGGSGSGSGSGSSGSGSSGSGSSGSGSGSSSGGASSGSGSSSGGPTSGASGSGGAPGAYYSVTFCPGAPFTAPDDIDSNSDCGNCLNQNCNGNLSTVNADCASYLTCACPEGSNVSACTGSPFADDGGVASTTCGQQYHFLQECGDAHCKGCGGDGG